MSAALPNNFLEPEPHLVAKLKLALEGQSPAVHVLTAADLDGVKEQAQHVPAVHVIYGGFRVLEARSDGRLARLRHTWLIVSCVRNVKGSRTGEAARRDAGNLAALAGAAVMGFKPPNVTSPMLMTDAPRERFSSGFMYLPLAFNVESLFKPA